MQIHKLERATRIKDEDSNRRKPLKVANLSINFKTDLFATDILKYCNMFVNLNCLCE